MQISMHRIDDKFIADLEGRAKMSLDSLPRLVAAARGRPQSLGILASAARTAAAYCYLVDPQSEEVSRALQLSRHALNALFACAINAPKATVVSLGGGEPVTYLERPDASSVYVGTWLDGFFLNLIFGDLEAVRKLCGVPTALLRESPTNSSEYRFLYKDALCAYVNAELDVVDRVIASLKATDPDHSDVNDRFMTLAIGVPQIEVFLYAVTRDQRFGTAMQRAIENHKAYWAKPQENARSFRGFIAIELLGLAVLGMDAGLSFDVQSSYLPMNLVDKI
jgi:hypothetical protein